MNNAPIVIFAYNRPWHLEQTLISLSRCQEWEESEVFVFCDGPKTVVDTAAVAEVDSVVEKLKSRRRIQHNKSSINLGLARSVIKGVTQVLQDFEEVIVLEDDMVVSDKFLAYMNEGLRHFRNEERVASIHGYVYPLKSSVPDAFFLRGADCWGWATWKRAWADFEEDGESLLKALNAKNLLWEFDMQGSYSYSQMLKDQVLGKNNSWAIRWHASQFLKNRLTLYPGKTMVRNIGLDGSGTHCAKDDSYASELSRTVPVMDHLKVEECDQAKQAFREFFVSQLPFYKKILRNLRMLTK